MHKRKNAIFVGVGIAVFTVIILLPFVVEISTALKAKNELFSFPSTIIPEKLQFSNLIEVWNLVPLKQVFQNTYFVIGCALIANFLISLPAAYALSAVDFPGKKLVLALAFIAQMFMPVLVVVPVFTMIRDMGLMDNLFALVLTGTAFSVSFVVLLMKGFFDTVPKEVVEAARIDGCSTFGVLTKIYMPLCASGIVVAVIYSAILVNNEFLFSNTLMNSTDNMVMSVAIAKLIKANPYEAVTWNYVMACAMWGALPIQIIFLFIRKHLAKGLTAGAIK